MALALLLVGCGGGGGGGGSSQAPIEDIVIDRTPVVDPQWTGEELAEFSNSGVAWSPRVAFDGAGNATSVWRQITGDTWQIWANRYVPGEGWGEPERIQSVTSDDANGPQVAVSLTGDAVAVWRQLDGGRYVVWANRYVWGRGWGTAEAIQADNSGEAYDPQIVIDANGTAVCVWEQFDDPSYSILANRSVAGEAWSGPTLVEDSDDLYAQNPQLAGGPAGSVIAVWEQSSDGELFSIWASEFVPGASWGTPELVETNDAGSAARPRIALDPAGNGIAVWRQTSGELDNMRANRYTAANGWGTAQLIEQDDTGNVGNPRIALDEAGNATVVWRQYDGELWNIRANRYDVANSTWGAAEFIETDDSGSASRHRVAVDPAGNALAVWRQFDGERYNIVGVPYDPVNGWGDTIALEGGDADANSPEVAFDLRGRALVMWHQLSGPLNSIWSNRYE